MSEILADFRWIGPHGIGRFAREVLSRLAGVEPLDVVGKPTDAIDPFRLSRALGRLRPKLFFSPGFNPPFRGRTEFVFVIHDLIHLRIPEESSAAKRLYYRLVVRPAVKRARRVLTISEFSRRDICAWAGVPPEQVVNVSNGVSAAFRPDGPRRQATWPYLLYVGNHKPHKNLTRTLEAFARADLGQYMRFVLTGQAEPDLRGLLRRLGIEHRVEFIGTADDADLAEYYRGATAVVLASLFEGFGLPAAEAMACGTPVIASNVTSLPEVVGEAAVSVDPLDTDAIAEAMSRVAADADLRRRLAAAGIERARQFSWQRTAELVQKVLDEAMLE